MTAVLYDAIYILPVCMLSVISATPFFLTFFEEGEGTSAVRITALTVCLCCFCVKHLKGRYKLLIPGAMLMLCAGVTVKYGNEEGITYLYEHRWVLWIVLTVVASFLAGWIISTNRFIRLIAAGLIFGGMMYFMIWGRGLERDRAVPAIFILLTAAADLVERHWEKSGYTDEKGHIVSVSPFILLLAVAVFLIPAPDKPYDWRITRSVISHIAEGVRAAGRFFRSGNEDYSAVMGFHDNNSYFGDLFKKERELMRITVSSGTGPVVYLSARVLDSFDGREWTKEYQGEYEDRRMDSIETVSAVMQYEPDYSFDYFKCIQARIEYQDFNTGFFFAPSKMIYCIPENEREKYTQRGFELEAQRKLGYGTDYVITFLRTNDHNTSYYEMTDAAQTTAVQAWGRARNWLGYSNDAATGTEEYSAYIGRMYKNYLPHTEISARAKEYMDVLLEDKTNDMEKLKAIEKVLSGYSYTLSPGELPEDIDSEAEFLDRLLFETKQGYCTHYATAFVIMARSIGIPARFVQGFRVPVKAGQTVSVMSSMSHAWPEAYIDGAGWTAFEPTPGMFVDSKWMFASREKYDALSDEEEEEEEEEEETQAPVPAGEIPDTDIAVEQEDKKDPGGILISLTLVVVFLLCFAFTDRMLQRQKYRKLCDNDKFRLCCRRNLKALSHLGYRLSPGETLEEFAHRCEEEINIKEFEISGFIGRYERFLYAGRDAVPEDIAKAVEDLDNICLLIRYSRGPLVALLARL